MKLRLITYSKKHNSSARPSWSAGSYKEVDFVFKKPTSINTPTLQLSNAPTSIWGYNYCYIVELDMYYYIVDIQYATNAIVEIQARVDAVATARPYIKASTAFVVYSSSNYNEYLRDDRVLAGADVTTVVSRTGLTNIIITNFQTSGYHFMLTTYSDLDGLASYLINNQTLSYLSKKLVEDGTSIWGSIKEMFGDAAGSIIDLKIIPFALDYLQTQRLVAANMSPIHLGDYDTGQQGYLVNDYCLEFSDVVSINFPDDFTRCSPYTEAKLFLPLIGTVDISIDELVTKNLGFHYMAHLATGEVAVQIMQGGGGSSQNGRILGNYNGQCNANYPIGFSQINGAGVVASAAGAIAGVASGGAITVAGIAGAVAGMANSFKQSASVINAFGGNFAGMGGNYVRVMLFKHGVSEDPDNMRQLYGRPCSQVLSLTNLTGYCQTSQFQLQSPLNDGIVQEVNSLMDSGVYLE